jgi:hypothetical protein
MLYKLLALSVLIAWTLSTHVRAEEVERVLFEDAFQGKLAEGWEWVHEDPANWRIKDGKFQIRATGGSAWAGNTDGKNYLLRKLPEVTEGELAVEVYAENRPTAPFEHVGIWWYADDDNYVTLNKEQFTKEPKIIYVVERKGKGEPPYAEIPYAAEGVWLRLRFSGTKIIGQYRATPHDEWKTAGSRERPAGVGRIGIKGGYAPKKETDRWASFSHFRIVQITELK